MENNLNIAIEYRWLLIPKHVRRKIQNTNIRSSLKGKRAPFYYVGQLNYVSHESSAPMDVLFKLQHPIPAQLLDYFGTRQRNV